MDLEILIKAFKHLPKTTATVNRIKFNNCAVIFDAFRQGKVLTSIYDPIITSRNSLWLAIKIESLEDILQIGNWENKHLDIIVDNNIYTGVLNFVDFHKKMIEITLS